MRVLVLFPKASCYLNKDSNTRTIYEGYFKENIKMLEDAGAEVTYLLEDKLAEIFLKDYPNKNVITCFNKGDLDFLASNGLDESVTEEVYNTFNSCKSVAGDITKEVAVPYDLIKRGKEGYLTARHNIAKKRYRKVIDRLVLESKAVLGFRCDNNLDKYTSMGETIQIGDGRLCMEVHINRGTMVSYYGGTYIERDLLPQILSM